MTIWQRIADGLTRGERACLITVVAAEGSSPREAGARMLATAGGGYSGTIGGGALEWQALSEAARLLAAHPDGRGITRSLVLGPDLGQCCGGRVSLRFEAFAEADHRWIAALARVETNGMFVTTGMPDARGIVIRTPYGPSHPPQPGVLREEFGMRRTPVLLFGAGHIGRALVLALAPLPFCVRWIDPRAEAFPGHQPANTTAILADNPVDLVASAEPGTLMLAITHSHALDFDLVVAGLQNPAITFVGVIGSATKRARFIGRLRALGLTETDIARLTCPIGLPDLASKEPAIIAAGIAVQLLQEHLDRASLPQKAALCTNSDRLFRRKTSVLA